MARLLGIDYGIKRIGLAITDELRIIASPFDTQQNTPKFWEYLQQLIKDYKIDGFVVGKPFHDGENSFVTEVLNFVQELHARFELPIYLVDESLTSKSSRDFLIQTGKRGKKLKADLDKYAAQAILNDFLIRGQAEQYQAEDHHETI